MPDCAKQALGEPITIVLELLDEMLLMGVGVSIFESTIVDKLPPNIKKTTAQQKKEKELQAAKKKKV